MTCIRINQFKPAADDSVLHNSLVDLRAFGAEPITNYNRRFVFTTDFWETSRATCPNPPLGNMSDLQNSNMAAYIPVLA